MFEKVKNFCCEHKHGIEMVLNTVLSIGGGLLAGYALFNAKKEPCYIPTPIAKETKEVHELDHFELTTGNLLDYWHELDADNAIIENIKLKDVGKVGENFYGKNGLNEESPCNVLIGMWSTSDD